MTQRRPERATNEAFNKLLSDPYREWLSVDGSRYQGFSDWLDLQLIDLEAQYSGWETPGYGHWRRLLDSQCASHEAEAAE